MIGQSLLGEHYAMGKGVDQNDALAVEWWEKAATQGQDVAQYYLGHCCMYGTHGLPKVGR